MLAGWRPSLLGWRPLLAGWRPSLLGWRPLLAGWRPSLLGWRPLLAGWRPSHHITTQVRLFEQKCYEAMLSGCKAPCTLEFTFVPSIPQKLNRRLVLKLIEFDLIGSIQAEFSKKQRLSVRFLTNNLCIRVEYVRSNVKP